MSEPEPGPSTDNATGQLTESGAPFSSVWVKIEKDDEDQCEDGQECEGQGIEDQVAENQGVEGRDTEDEEPVVNRCITTGGALRYSQQARDIVYNVHKFMSQQASDATKNLINPKSLQDVVSRTSAATGVSVAALLAIVGNIADAKGYTANRTETITNNATLGDKIKNTYANLRDPSRETQLVATKNELCIDNDININTEIPIRRSNVGQSAMRTYTRKKKDQVKATSSDIKIEPNSDDMIGLNTKIKTEPNLEIKTEPHSEYVFGTEIKVEPISEIKTELNVDAVLKTKSQSDTELRKKNELKRFIFDDDLLEEQGNISKIKNKKLK